MDELSCSFCKELKKGMPIIQYKDRKIKIKRIIYESPNFVVFPSLGQIVEGYLLIVPKQHYISIAQIPNKFYLELKQVQEKIRKVLAENYCPPIFFEHGPISKREKAGCCIEHAHLHAVPTDVSLLEEILKHFPGKIINSFSELPTSTAYLFVEEKEKYIFPINTILPSQYLRQILAVKTGNPEKWDWRTYLGLKEFENTIKKLKENL